MAKSWLIAIALLGVSPILDAQGYSIQGTFDTSKVVTLRGVITGIRGGPLTYLFLDVQEEGGRAIPWMLRLSASSLLTERGFPLDSFPRGSEIQAEVWVERTRPNGPISPTSIRAKVPPGTSFGAAWRLTLADGRVLDEASRPLPPWPAETEIFSLFR